MVRIVSSGKALHSPEFHHKRSRTLRIRRILFTTLFLLCFVGIILLFRMERFLVTDVLLTGSAAVREDMVEEIAQETLNGNYLLVLPKSNVLLHTLLSRNNLREDLLDQILRISSAKFRLVDAKTLEISIEERKPHALYCEPVSIGTDGKCSFVDEKGFVFATAPSFSRGVFFIYTGLPISGAEKFVLLESFIEKLDTLGIESDSLDVSNASGHRTKYALFLVDGGEIWWNDNQDWNLAYSNLETFLLSDIVAKDPNFLSKINYIDLRTDNKVFYKFK